MLLTALMTGCTTAPEVELAEKPALEEPADQVEETVTEVAIEEIKEISYSFKTITVDENDNNIIKYPQIVGLKGELSQDYINQSLAKIRDVYGKDNYKNVSIDFEVTYMDENYFSVLYRGTVEIDGFKAFDVVKSMTLDMHSTNEIEVDNFIVGENKLQTLKKLFKEEGINDFEAESVFLYFQGDQVVFYFMPLDDDADFRFIPVKIEGHGSYFNWDFGAHPAS